MKFSHLSIRKLILLNASLLIGFLLAFIILLSVFIRFYTHHGESLTVPDFKGFPISKVQETCKDEQLRYKIIDSVFVEGIPFFTVFDQSPKALSKVKMNRTIYLTITTSQPPKVKLPNIIDVTLRQAIALLESFGLKPGELRYIPGIAQNVVVDMELNGKKIKPGSIVKKGSYINLILEDGLKSDKVGVQDLNGLTVDEVLFALSASGINIGAKVFDKGVTDSIRAVVYKQIPPPNSSISAGGDVDIWLTTPGKFKEMNIKTNNTKDDNK